MRTPGSHLLRRLGDVFKQSTMVFTDQTGLPKLYGMVAYCLDTTTCRYRHFACILCILYTGGRA